MKTLLGLCVTLLVVSGVVACTAEGQALRDASSRLLSAKEVTAVFAGNTATAADGKAYYFNPDGVIVGKDTYGDIQRGSWNISPEGQLCFGNRNARLCPTTCYKVYFDNVSQQRKLVDADGEVQYTVIAILTGNPNNF